MSTSVTQGGCLCGATRYQANGPPSSSMVCHCRTCRQAAGSPLVAWLTFPAESFSFVRGQPAEFRSSTPVTRTFCSSCATPLKSWCSHCGFENPPGFKFCGECSAPLVSSSKFPAPNSCQFSVLRLCRRMIIGVRNALVGQGHFYNGLRARSRVSEGLARHLDLTVTIDGLRIAYGRDEGLQPLADRW